MSKEGNFLIYCMERFHYFKGLSGAEVAKLFEKYDIYKYIVKYFEALHTMGIALLCRILMIILSAQWEMEPEHE